MCEENEREKPETRETEMEDSSEPVTDQIARDEYIEELIDTYGLRLDITDGSDIEVLETNRGSTFEFVYEDITFIRSHLSAIKTYIRYYYPQYVREFMPHAARD